MLTQTAIRNFSMKQPASQLRPTPLAGSPAHVGAIELMGACMSFPRNTEIYGENEPADYLYKIVSGTVRTYKVLVDGRRQIGAFLCLDSRPATSTHSPPRRLPIARSS